MTTLASTQIGSCVSVNAVLALICLSIHIHGASFRKVYQWNSTPVDLDFYPERLWDWKDPQFLGRRS